MLEGGTLAQAWQVTGRDGSPWSSWTPRGSDAGSDLAIVIADTETYVFTRAPGGSIAAVHGTLATGWSTVQLGGSFQRKPSRGAPRAHVIGL